MKKVNSAIIIGLALLLIYPWQELATAGGMGFIRNNVGWLVIILLSSIFSWGAFTHKNYSVPHFWLVGLIGCFIACVPFLVNTFQFAENSLWLPFGLLFSWLFLLSALNCKAFIESKHLVLIIVISLCVLQVLVSFWQLFHSYMMEATSGVAEHKLPPVKGTFNQRNLYASFIATALVCAFYVFPVKKSLILGTRKIQTRLQNRLILCFIGAASFTLILTDSRAGIYSLVACLALLFFTYRRIWKKKLVKSTALVFIGVIAAQVVINFIYDNETKDFSNTANRGAIYFASVEVIKDKPLLGYGLGSFERTYLEKLSSLINSEKLDYEEVEGRAQNLTHPHNEFLYWAVQGGLVSILGLLIIIFCIASLLRHSSLNKSLAYIALLLPITFHMMVELPFYISAIHLITYVLLIAYVVASIGSFKSYRININNSGFIKVITSILVLVLSCGLLLNAYSLSRAAKFQKALNPDLNDLDKVILRLGWNDDYWALRLRYEANRAAKLGLDEPAMRYLNWLEQQVVITPRLNYYFNLFAVSRYLEKNAEATFYYHEIKRLFRGVEEAENWLETNRDH